MVDGRLMPQSSRVLAKIIAVTYLGVGPLPKDWLSKTFRVRRFHVREAPSWLKTNNKRYYGNIEISVARLNQLPDNDVPVEILANIRQEHSGGMAEREMTWYRGDTDEGNNHGEVTKMSE